MTSEIRRRIGRLVVMLALVPATAAAQTVARSFAELQQVLKTGQTVYVTDKSGRQTKGNVADVSASSLVLLTPDSVTFSEATVMRVNVADGLRKGVLIGLAVGAGVGAVSGVALAMYCPNEGGPCPGTIVGMGALFTGVGTAIGAGVDALVNKVGTLVYVSPEQTSAMRPQRMTLSPIVGKSRQGVLVSVAF